MSVKELVVVPKQKFDSLTNSIDNTKDTKNVACQTNKSDSEVESLSSSSKPKVEDETASASVGSENNSEQNIQRIIDGIPGKLNRRPRQSRRKTNINWIPY